MSLIRLVLALIFLMPVSVIAEANPVKVSVILGDTHSMVSVQSVKSIKKELPEFKDVDFRVYPSIGIRDADLTYLKESKLIVFLARGRQLFDSIAPELKEAAQKGAHICAVGETQSEDFEQIGIVRSKQLNEYFNAGGMENIKNMLVCALNLYLGFAVKCEEAKNFPAIGIYEHKTKMVYQSYEDYNKMFSASDISKPVVGIVIYKSSVDAGQTKHIDALIEVVEKAGFKTLTIYGYPSESAIEKFFIDEQGKSRVRLVIALGMKIGVTADKGIQVLSKLNVPVINAITLFSQSRQQWEKSPSGLDVFERAWQIALPELAGTIQPTVIASKEKYVDKETGIEFIEEQPIPERMERITDRIKAWINLQNKQNKDKKIALVYYTYPPGKHNIGASYLNVLPGSLLSILNRLKDEGYYLGDKPLDKEFLFHDVFTYGRNIGNWAYGEIDRLARSGKPVMIPLAEYKKWFQELPVNFQNAVIKDWGPVEKSTIMIWKGGSGTKYLIIPAVKYGNMLLAPQPSRGWEQDPGKLYHNISLTPHHQYIAFYLWLKKGFNADAVVHIGTHSTHEWLSGKEVGFTAEDPPEILIKDIPNIYPYIVDDVGEGLQAKRRGMAVIIDHMTPPFDKAGLNNELRQLTGLISDYESAKDKSPSLTEIKIGEIDSLAKEIGILADLKKTVIKTDADVSELEHYIKDIGEKNTPFGLHTFGKSPEKKLVISTAEAIISLDKKLSDEEIKRLITDIEKKIYISAKNELNHLVEALAGKYVPAGSGNDPIRNPDSLPTGKNFYSFDPAKIPSKGTYETAVKLADELINNYKLRHGIYPDKLTFNLWGVETIRHEGIMDSQILYLMGIEPEWDERGKVTGLKVIPREKLGRPRIDVTIVPSGLYRDLFSNLIALLDKAVSLAKEQDEKDNILRANYLNTKKMLIGKGIPQEQAERLASVRIFTVPPGAYGTNLEKVIPLSNTWDNEKQLADIYFMRMGHMYGQGFWGSSEKSGDENISQLLLKNALAGSKIAVHSRSGNVYATLDNDDFFQYLGGTAMAIRSVDGKTPEIYITNLSNPKNPKQESLEKYMGKELRSRYLNPAWINAMMKEGYSGARFVNKVFENMWGWQVTAPEAVDTAKWNEMYETYVLDKNGVGIKNLFRDAKNMYAYQSIVARMIEIVRKDYWKADKQVVETLAKEYAESVNEVGLACCDHTCNNPQLTKFTSDILVSVPGLKNMNTAFMNAYDYIKTPQTKNQHNRHEEKRINAIGKHTLGKGLNKVEGFEMENTNTGGGGSAPIPYLFIFGFLFFIGLILIGWKRK